MKNPWKSRHLLFGVHRGYGIQNDRLDLTINEFLAVWKTMHRGLRYFQFFEFFCLTFLVAEQLYKHRCVSVCLCVCCPKFCYDLIGRY